MRVLSTVFTAVVLVFSLSNGAEEKVEKPQKGPKIVPKQAAGSINGIANDHIIKNIINNPFLSDDNEYNKDVIPMKTNKNIVFKDAFPQSGDDSDLDLSKYRKIPYPLVYDDQSRYSCYVPIHRSAKDNEAPKEGSNVKKEDLVREMVDKVLSPMDGKCLIQKNTGWWWYKYCHNKEAVQFHFDIEKKGVGDEYVLGKRNLEASIEDDYEFNLDKMEYSEMYTDGTVCDLTRKPRAIKVSFVCSPRTPESGELISVQEVSSCNYHAIIRTPLVCKHSFFRSKVKEEENAKTKNIICKLENHDNTLVDEYEFPGEETCRIKYGENLGKTFEDEVSSVGSTIGGGYPAIGEDVFNGVFSSTEEALKSKEIMAKIKARMKQLIEEQRAKNGENTNNNENTNNDGSSNNNNNLDDIKIVYINANDLDISYPAEPIKPEEDKIGSVEEERGENINANVGSKNNNNNDDIDDDDDENSDDEDIVKDEL